MKASHFQTPRTLADCEFSTGYPAIERAQHRVDLADRIVAWGAFAAFAALAVIFSVRG